MPSASAGTAPPPSTTPRSVPAHRVPFQSLHDFRQSFRLQAVLTSPTHHLPPLHPNARVPSHPQGRHRRPTRLATNPPLAPSQPRLRSPQDHRPHATTHHLPTASPQQPAPPQLAPNSRQHSNIIPYSLHPRITWRRCSPSLESSTPLRTATGTPPTPPARPPSTASHAKPPVLITCSHYPRPRHLSPHSPHAWRRRQQRRHRSR